MPTQHGKPKQIKRNTQGPQEKQHKASWRRGELLNDLSDTTVMLPHRLLQHWTPQACKKVVSAASRQAHGFLLHTRTYLSPKAALGSIPSSAWLFTISYADPPYAQGSARRSCSLG